LCPAESGGRQRRAAHGVKAGVKLVVVLGRPWRDFYGQRRTFAGLARLSLNGLSDLNQ
jgi:hypothetical protein